MLKKKEGRSGRQESTRATNKNGKNMVGINPAISIITLNINGVNTSEGHFSRWWNMSFLPKSPLNALLLTTTPG